MRDKLLLVGAGGFGRVVLEHAVLEYDCAFIDDGPEIGTLVNGTPVIGRTTIGKGCVILNNAVVQNVA